METLSAKRCRFTHDVALLILQAEKLGYSCAIDQVKRTQLEANANAASGVGIANSLHLIGLAADLLLYKDGSYLKGEQGYSDLGMWCESFSASHAWGGRFKIKDYGHFSIEHNGVK